MLSRRGFMAGTLGGGMLLSAEALLRSPEVLAFPSNVLPQQAGSDRVDWTKDSRWGLEYLRTNKQTVEWPNKARVAYMISVPFEMQDPGEQPPENSVATSEYTYGGKEGVWRIMDILDRHKIKGDFIFNSITAVVFPEAVKAIGDRGHGLICHWWANNISQSSASVEKDREYILRTYAILEQVAGRKPVGWVAPGFGVGPKTLDIVAIDEDQIMNSNNPDNDDLPFTVNYAGKKILAIPHSIILNDYSFTRTHNPPSAYIEVLKSDFDRKYAEGASSPKLCNFIIHSHLSGRAFFADALDELISYFRSFPEVWFTTREEIASWWIKQNYL